MCYTQSYANGSSVDVCLDILLKRLLALESPLLPG